MRRSRPSRLVSTIGRLSYLAGTFCMVLSSATSVDAMLYRPKKTELWDVWVFHDDGTYYLFYDVAVDGSNAGLE